jgi:hypothetical protein
MIDPYAVSCPACLAEPGQRCTNRIRQLDSVHWSRHWLARQRRHHRATPERREPTPVAAGGRGTRARSG